MHKSRILDNFRSKSPLFEYIFTKKSTFQVPILQFFCTIRLRIKFYTKYVQTKKIHSWEKNRYFWPLWHVTKYTRGTFLWIFRRNFFFTPKTTVVTSFVRNVSNVRNVRIFPYIKSRYVRNVRNVSNVGNVRNARVPQRVVSAPKIPALANLSFSNKG